MPMSASDLAKLFPRIIAERDSRTVWAAMPSLASTPAMIMCLKQAVSMTIRFYLLKASCSVNSGGRKWPHVATAQHGRYPLNDAFRAGLGRSHFQ